MGTIPTTTNTAAQTVEEIIATAIDNVGVQAAEAAIIALLPFLGWPIIKQLMGAAVSWIAGKFTVNLEQIGVKMVIDIQTADEQSAYETAEAALRAAHLTGDPNALQQASDNFDTMLASLIHWDGSAPVST